MAEEEEPVRVSFDVLDEEDRSSLADLEEELDEEERVKQRNMRAEKVRLHTHTPPHTPSDIRTTLAGTHSRAAGEGEQAQVGYDTNVGSLFQ